MTNNKLCKVLDILEVGNPIGDYWDELDLIIELASALAKERGL